MRKFLRTRRYAQIAMPTRRKTPPLGRFLFYFFLRFLRKKENKSAVGLASVWLREEPSLKL